jgi:hypothetical protein
MVSGPLSSSHPTVRLAERVWTESEGQSAVASDEVTAFRLTGVPVERLYTEALGVRGKFRAWGWILGGFIGLVVGVKLTQLSIWRTQVDYEADRVRCVSCARCFETCPYEHVRRGTYVGVPPGTAGGGSGEGPSARGTDATAAKESGPGETGGHRT